MPDSRRRWSRGPLDVQPPCTSPPARLLADFYREEFIKHRQCLHRQREYYSERAITDVDAAISRILNQLEQLCQKQDADEVVSRLLRKFDLVTRLSAWTDPKNLH